MCNTELPKIVKFNGLSYDLVRKKAELFILLYGDYYRLKEPIHVHLKWFIIPEYKIVYERKEG